MSLTFALQVYNLFHHRYIDKSFTKGNKRQVFLQSQFLHATILFCSKDKNNLKVVDYLIYIDVFWEFLNILRVLFSS